MNTAAQIDFARLESRKVSLSDNAMSLLRTLQFRTDRTFPDLIETALMGYSRALKESE